VETIYTIFPKNFHKKEKNFSHSIFIDFDVLLYLKGARLELDFRRKKW